MKVTWHDMRYFLTVFVLPPVGSSTVHIYTKNKQNDTIDTDIVRTTQLTN